jgi:DNA-binding transcriptional ArsR family regulator
MNLQQNQPIPDIGAIFHALGDQTRRDIVERLSYRPHSVSELSGPLEMTLTGVSQHLRILADCGLVRTEKNGRVRECTLVPEGFSAIDRWTSLTRARCEMRLDRLGDLLDEDD